jgi:hypothetical protein
MSFFNAVLDETSSRRSLSVRRNPQRALLWPWSGEGMFPNERDVSVVVSFELFCVDREGRPFYSKVIRSKNKISFAKHCRALADCDEVFVSLIS